MVVSAIYDHASARPLVRDPRRAASGGSGAHRDSSWQSVTRTRCDAPTARRRRKGVEAMTLGRPAARSGAAPLTFAEAAERHLDDVFGYLLYLTRDRALADDLAGAHLREGVSPVGALRPASGERAHLAARDRPHDRARLVPRRVAAPEARGGCAPSRRREEADFVEGLSPALAGWRSRRLSAGEREVLVLRIVIELDGEADRPRARDQPDGRVDPAEPRARRNSRRG